MITLTKIGLLALGVPFAFATAGLHAHMGGHHRMVREFVQWRVERKLDAIQATPSQRQEFEAAEKRLFDRADALHGQMAGYRRETLTLLAADQPAAARLHELVDSRAAAIKTFGDTLTDEVLQLHGRLTPEQRQQLLADAREHLGAD
jgi:protein CpxP